MKTFLTTILLLIVSSIGLSQGSLDSGLVAFYPFNGNADDESINNNNGTIYGAQLSYDRYNVKGRSYSFNGSSDYIDIGNDPSLKMTEYLSLSVWVKPNVFPLPHYHNIISDHGEGNNNTKVLRFYQNAIEFLLGPEGSTEVRYVFPNTIANQWQHIIATYDGNFMRLFINGTVVDSASRTGTITANSLPVLIGNSYFNEFFPGDIDDIRIYQRAINSEEVLALYNDSTTYSPQLISSVYPLQNSNNCLRNESIRVSFTEPMNEATFTYNSVSTFGNLTGSYELSFVYHSTINSLEITPTVPFKYGEQITVTLDSSIQSVSGYNLLPFIFQFNIKPEKGSVRFAVADSFQLNFSPTNIVSGDFNNDDKIDVIVSNYDSSKYTVLLNNGSGGFTIVEEMTGEFKPYSISLTDIDSDRDLDMIVSTNEQNKIRLLRGSGQGIFSWVLPYTDVNAPIATCPGDFDGDGDNDFVAMLAASQAYCYRNDGTGVFTVYDTINTGAASIRNIVGDIDNDDDLDIIGGTSDYWGVFKILRNDGNGNFTYTGGPYLGPNPDELAGGDFDGDYNLDFVKCDWYQNGIGIAINNGLGEYPVENFFNLGNVGGQTRNPIVNDFDGDGDLDFVGVFNNNNIGIVKNNTPPNYELSLSYPIPGLKGIAAGDFNNNGSFDLVGINSTTNQIIFIKNCLDSLVAYWPFDGNISDTSGNLNNGINYGGTFDYDRYGNSEHSIYFEGSSSYAEGINPGNNLPIGNTPRTFTCWLKSSEAPSSRNIFHYGTAQPAPTNYHLFLQEGKFVGIGNGYGYGILISTNDIGDGTWHLITTVYEGNSTNIQKIYIDGKLDISDIISSEPNTALTNSWKIGQFMGGSPSFLGNIDDLQIFNFALTEQNVLDIYKQTTTAPHLIFPGKDSTLINPIMLNLVLDWDSTVTSTGYRLLLANDSLFNTVIHDTVVNISSFNFYDWFTVNIDNLYWKVRTINDGGIGPWSEINHFNIILTDIEEESQLPIKFALLQNYPNPFNPGTIIQFTVPTSPLNPSPNLGEGNRERLVSLKVFDVLGNEIATLVDEYKPAGSYEIEFQSSTGKRQLASGVYYYQLRAGDFLETKKMVLIK